MFPIVVGRGGASTWLTIRLHCLVRVTRLGTPLHKSLELVAIARVWKFLIFCFAYRCLRRCPGSRVMSEYGVLAYVSGGVPTLGSLAVLVGQGWGLVRLYIGHDLALPESGRWL